MKFCLRATIGRAPANPVRITGLVGVLALLGTGNRVLLITTVGLEIQSLARSPPGRSSAPLHSECSQIFLIIWLNSIEMQWCSRLSSSWIFNYCLYFGAAQVQLWWKYFIELWWWLNFVDMYWIFLWLNFVMEIKWNSSSCCNGNFVVM